MTGRRAETATDWLETAWPCCDRQALEALWAAVPEPMRLARFTASTVPAAYAGGFCQDGTWRAGVDLTGLPEPLRRDLVWCVFRIIELGGKIPTPTLGMLVRRLGEVITDHRRQPLDFQRTHRFRHTVATNLLNAGARLHVVQRYLGHLTPTMSMTYAQTLQATAEAEFLRYRKISADARDLDIDPRDLYDMLELDRRADRILPNGWCLLPPRQVCVKGNACLTCDKFATDQSFLPELRTQQAHTAELIEQRRAAFLARTGRQMGGDNVWLAGRRQEHDALGRIIVTLERTRLADGSMHAVRGAGVDARTDALLDKQAHA